MQEVPEEIYDWSLPVACDPHLATCKHTWAGQWAAAKKLGPLFKVVLFPQWQKVISSLFSTNFGVSCWPNNRRQVFEKCLQDLLFCWTHPKPWTTMVTEQLSSEPWGTMWEENEAVAAPERELTDLPNLVHESGEGKSLQSAQVVSIFTIWQLLHL